MPPIMMASTKPCSASGYSTAINRWPVTKNAVGDMIANSTNTINTVGMPFPPNVRCNIRLALCQSLYLYITPFLLFCQYPWSVFRYGDSVLELGGQALVYHSPTFVLELFYLPFAGTEHRFYGKYHPRLQ